MYFLPVVERELRAAARRRSTFRVRWWAVLLGLGLTLFMAVVMTMTRTGSVGSSVFGLLTTYAVGMSLLAGVVLTADALTEEKKAGTLGLLFLTNLKGHDVVLGKFIAQSVTAFYCLLALLPITALPILLGGVEGAEFWRTALALSNALFFSLAAGICVSVFMRDSHKAMVNTLGILFLLCAILPLINRIPLRSAPTALNYIPWLSPIVPFTYASEMLYARHASTFWGSCALSQLMAWGFLAIGSFALPHVVQERRFGTALTRRSTRSPKAMSSPAIREVLNRDPVQWLRAREMDSSRAAWLIAIGWVVVALATGYLNGGAVIGYASIPFGFLLKVLFTFQVCRFFVEARTNGALELLLCTPLRDHEIIDGQRRGIWRTFTGPFILFGMGLFVPALIYHKGVSYELAGAFFLSGVQALRFVADLFALQWMGMALALTGKKPRLAPALTILWVLILPSVFCWLDALIDLIFIAWGTGKCRQNLRRLAAEQYSAVVV